MFFGIYILVASIFLFFSIVSLSVWLIEKKRKNDLYLGIVFFLLSISYGIYSLTSGMLVDGEYTLNYAGYILDLLAGFTILFVAINNLKNNKEFFKKLFKK